MMKYKFNDYTGTKPGIVWRLIAKLVMYRPLGYDNNLPTGFEGQVVGFECPNEEWSEPAWVCPG